MKTEQFFALGYLVLGICFGVVSNTFVKTGFGLSFALGIPLIVYFASLSALMKLVKQKKKTWVFSNSLVTFVLIWLIVWILLHNL